MRLGYKKPSLCFRPFPQGGQTTTVALGGRPLVANKTGMAILAHHFLYGLYCDSLLRDSGFSLSAFHVTCGYVCSAELLGGESLAALFPKKTDRLGLQRNRSSLAYPPRPPQVKKPFSVARNSRVKISLERAEGIP